MPFIFLLVFSLLSSSSLVAADTIISDGRTLVSPAGAFELGFFNLPDSSSRYVGIWYKLIPGRTVVWVANRDKPITGSSGVLDLTTAGNLTLHDGADVLWSTNTAGLANPVLHLLDSGNLVLTSDQSNEAAWQSFDHPTDTMLPGMKIGWDLRSNRERRLTSWKTTSDPSPGPYSLGLTLHPAADIYVWNGTAPAARIGPWDGVSWGGAAPLRSDKPIRHDYIHNQNESYYSYEMTDKSVTSRVIIDPSGVVRRFNWVSQQWSLYALDPADPCDPYGHCGAYGLCDMGDNPICKCLVEGFVPKSQYSWNPSAGSDGCVRRTALGCRKGGDGFVKVVGVRLPEMSTATADGGKGMGECREACLNNCNCTAFAFLGGSTSSGCISWFDRLVDVRALSERSGEDLYVRLAASELPPVPSPPLPGNKKHSRVAVIVAVSVTFVFLFLIIPGFILIRRRRKTAFKWNSRSKSNDSIATNIGESDETGMKFLRYHFSTIVRATNNFSEEAKLGEGGFGPVYKGRLLESQEIAVKRLAANSGQGLQEFDNEILLIAKLQHRNLVRLLGCCIHQEEKMLIYEYMPNKSLDLYIFDPTRRAQLNWHNRFHIIEGIAQGLLYLHKYSRLRIIHRDLKASNILLDDDMNPKISDFGIAKIFSSNEIQEKTRRVIGTYGYMAPEYAAEGLFSIKSDVFSFGVILLEIISGKKNSFIYDHQKEKSQNLLGYAWSLWKEDKWGELVDPLLEEGCDMIAVRRCIHVGLTCVQDCFLDRPTMSDAITMLSSESALLPDPKEPAYFNLRVTTRVDSQSTVVSENCSLNEVTITVIESR